jgi:hypothetical protein
MTRQLLSLTLISIFLAGCATTSLPLHDPEMVALGCDQVAQGALRAVYGPPVLPPPPSTTTTVAGTIGTVALLSFHALSLAVPPAGAIVGLVASGATAVGGGAVAMAGAPSRPPLQEPQRTHYHTALTDCMSRHGIHRTPTL